MDRRMLVSGEAGAPSVNQEFLSKAPVMASHVLGQVAEVFGVSSLNPFKAVKIKQEG